MDFEPSMEQTAAADLAAQILADHCTPERLKEVDAGEERFDEELRDRFAWAGLIGLPLPEDNTGGGLGLLELCSVLVEVGRYVAPLPLMTHVPTAMAISRFGTIAQTAMWLEGAVTGESILTSALAEERSHCPEQPSTWAEHDGESWLLTGVKTSVPAGTLAELFVVPAHTADGLTIFLVHPDDPGVVVVPQVTTDGDRAGRLELQRAAVPTDRLLGEIGGGADILTWLRQHLTVALCAQQLGTLEGALQLTAEYARTREQFGRPIGTFQAVSQRLADAYIDVLGARLTCWQAAWRLSEGLPAEAEIASAKLWAADAGHRVAHTTVHVHGGVGIDLDGQAHRFFTALKRNEFTLGGATDQARAIGRLLAAAPA